MKAILFNYKEYFVLLGCILVSLILIFSGTSRQIDAIKIITIDAMGLLQERLSSFSRYSALKEQNTFLRYQNTLLALENSRMRAAYLENERLRRLIGFKERSKFRLVAAKVIGGSTTGFMNYLLLNVGKQDGIVKNMPIVVPEGLVGKIYQVRQKISRGHLLFDQNFRVSAKVQRSSIKGIISWKGGQVCELNEVPNRSDVKVGDLVVTSGYSDIFPEGLYIGKIISAENTRRKLFMKIKVKPDVDFNRIEEVLVLVNNKKDELIQ